MKNILFLIMMLATFTACADKKVIEGKNPIRGIWVSQEGEMLILENRKTTFYKELFKDNNFIVSIEDNKLRITAEGNSLYNDIPKGEQVEYNFQIQKITDTKLTLKVLDKNTKSAFSGRSKIEFIKKEAFKDEKFELEKLVFNSSMCFGVCPVLNLTVLPDRTMELEATYFEKMGVEDKEKSGFYKGTIDEELYKQIVNELIQTRIGVSNYTPLNNCCDGAIKTITTHHNGMVNEMSAMFPPSIANQLITLLYQATQSESLVKVK